MKKKIFPVLSFLIIFCSAIFAQIYETGDINGAKFFLNIPENWNNGLVMYAHGYEGIGEEVEPLEEELGEFQDIFTGKGFAFAASNYKKQGLVIKDGIEDTEALRTYFEIKYGKPDICIITGHSMGGIISLATIEKYPAEYDGAMPLCGWLAPVFSLFKNSLDMLALYDYLFGENNGKIVEGEEFIEQESIRKNLDEKPALAELYAEHFRIRGEDLAEVLEFYQQVFKESTNWLGGLPAGNEQTIYSGFGDKNRSFNKEIRRYISAPEAEEYFIQYYTPTGEIRDPVLAIHTTYDEILPVYNYEYFQQITRILRTENLYFQNYIVRDGHCNFTEEEIGTAFDQLLTWIKEGKRPENNYR